VNNIVDTSGKTFLLVKLVTTARCVRVLFVTRIESVKNIEVVGGRTTKTAISIIIV
jgi:hypothetical protein